MKVDKVRESNPGISSLQRKSIWLGSSSHTIWLSIRIPSLFKGLLRQKDRESKICSMPGRRRRVGQPGTKIIRNVGNGVGVLNDFLGEGRSKEGCGSKVNL